MLPRLHVLEPFDAVLSGELATVSAPVWAPWPLPDGWTFGGVGHSDADSAGESCTVASWYGEDPFGEPAEMLLVCEEAGTGLGGWLAGLSVSYPGPGVGEGPPHARFTIDNRPVPLWSVAGADDRGVYAGEAAGRWLWVVMHPAEASALVVQPLRLIDVRTLGGELTTLPLGELSPRLMVG